MTLSRQWNINIIGSQKGRFYRAYLSVKTSLSNRHFQILWSPVRRKFPSYRNCARSSTQQEFSAVSTPARSLPSLPVYPYDVMISKHNAISNVSQSSIRRGQSSFTPRPWTKYVCIPGETQSLVDLGYEYYSVDMIQPKPNIQQI